LLSNCWAGNRSTKKIRSGLAVADIVLGLLKLLLDQIPETPPHGKPLRIQAQQQVQIRQITPVMNLSLK
jgi:hypothetical protein